MRNIKLTIQYDGTGFAGWQRQRDNRTVQQVIEEALRRITGEKTTLTGAGRTDAGVHALGQVANFHNKSSHPPQTFLAALNATLDSDVAVVRAEEVDEVFHARKDAQGKRYQYVIWNAAIRPVFDRQHMWHFAAAVNLDAMREAALSLTGEHDFRSFARATPSDKDCVRRIHEISIVRDEPRVTLTLIGNGFLYTMVRSIVGTLMQVGLGKIEPLDIKRILEARDRREAGPTAPARGLTLIEVVY